MQAQEHRQGQVKPGVCLGWPCPDTWTLSSVACFLSESLWAADRAQTRCLLPLQVDQLSFSEKKLELPSWR